MKLCDAGGGENVQTHTNQQNACCVSVCVCWRAARELGVGGQSAFFRQHE